MQGWKVETCLFSTCSCKCEDSKLCEICIQVYYNTFFPQSLATRFDMACGILIEKPLSPILLFHDCYTVSFYIPLVSRLIFITLTSNPKSSRTVTTLWNFFSKVHSLDSHVTMLYAYTIIFGIQSLVSHYSSYHLIHCYAEQHGDTLPCLTPLNVWTLSDFFSVWSQCFYICHKCSLFSH